MVSPDKPDSGQTRLNQKLVVIINGKGGSGKDTVCGIAGQRYKISNISAITPIKEIAAQCGWNGEKDLRSRRFLSDLKRLLAGYNDMPNTYLEKEYKSFLLEDCDILFVHIREPDQIDGFRARVHSKCITLLVRHTGTGSGGGVFGNASDDGVDGYSYDYVFENDCSLEELSGKFLGFLQGVLDCQGVVQASGPSPDNCLNP